MNDSARAGRKTAGAFDIRNIIGLLLGVYGVILVAMGLFADPELAKTGGVNANLWTGIVLAVFAAGFLGWAKARPIVVPADVHADGAADRPAHGGH